MYQCLITMLGHVTFGFLVFIALWIIVNRILRLCRSSSINFRGATVLITGASSGLGWSLAEVLYERGCKVILAARNVEKLEELRRHLKESSSSKRNAKFESNDNNPEVIELDLNYSQSIERATDEIRRACNGRRLDVLINNAGMSVRGSCDETSMDVHRRLMQVNYFGHVQLTKSLMPILMSDENAKASKPCIVGISSVQGRVALPFRSAYSASKHAFQAYFDALRSELSASRIRVLTISPGYIRTNLSTNALTGGGESYGRMDETTDGGMSAREAAEAITRAIEGGSEDIVLARFDAKAAILIRALVPWLYFWIMRKRAARAKKSI